MSGQVSKNKFENIQDCDKSLIEKLEKMTFERTCLIDDFGSNSHDVDLIDSEIQVVEEKMSIDSRIIYLRKKLDDTIQNGKSRTLMAEFLEDKIDDLLIQKKTPN